VSPLPHDPTSSPDPHPDPRVIRTKGKVLAVVRSILEQHGPTAVTYSAVARASGVGRQTLYNHWATPEEMVIDAAQEHDGEASPIDAGSIGEATDRWLHEIAAALADRHRHAEISSLIALAPHSPTSESALREMIESHRTTFDDALAPLGTSCPAETYARMVGPLYFQVLLAREPVNDELIDAIATSTTHELDAA
jgi:AcrR family transcriptional regulator